MMERVPTSWSPRVFAIHKVGERKSSPKQVVLNLKDRFVSTVLRCWSLWINSIVRLCYSKLCNSIVCGNILQWFEFGDRSSGLLRLWVLGRYSISKCRADTQILYSPISSFTWSALLSPLIQVRAEMVSNFQVCNQLAVQPVTHADSASLHPVCECLFHRCNMFCLFICHVFTMFFLLSR